MTTKCTGLMGRIFGHKWLIYSTPASRDIAVLVVAISFPDIEQNSIPKTGAICQRCGAVTGEK